VGGRCKPRALHLRVMVLSALHTRARARAKSTFALFRCNRRQVCRINAARDMRVHTAAGRGLEYRGGGVFLITS